MFARNSHGMSAGIGAVPEWLSFRRIVDVPFETCVAALDSWQLTSQDGDLRIGESLLRGPIEHDRDSGTCRVEVRLARGPLRPLLRMRLHIDRWSSSSTALELIPNGRVRPTAGYFRGGHQLLGSLIHLLPQHGPRPMPQALNVASSGSGSQTRAMSHAAVPTASPQPRPPWNQTTMSTFRPFRAAGHSTAPV